MTLKELARHLGLSPTTLSLVLNGSPRSASISAKTRERILDAARGLDYRPSYLARSLRAQRTFTVGVMIPELSDRYSSLVLSGIEEYLLRKHYMFLVASHHHDQGLIERHARCLLERCVEGIIAVNAPPQRRSSVPVVCVSGYRKRGGGTSVILNHDKAAELALAHLASLGHRRVAVFKGQHFIPDSIVRWRAIQTVSRRMGLIIQQKNVVQLEGASCSPEPGYRAGNQLLEFGAKFTALLAFSDVSALGAARAFRDAGYRVPDQISIIGFDDVHEAAYHLPALTTIRQPLARMGALAAEALLERMESKSETDRVNFLRVDPELIVRESTSRAQALP